MMMSLGMWLLGSLVLVLAGVGWLLFRLIGHLRKSSSRYRWFELFTCVFLIAWGFFIMLRLPPGEWSPWWAWFAGGSILAGSANLGIVFLAQFPGRRVLRCSFCNKSQRDVKKLIAGPRVFICDECVDICVTIITEEKVAGQMEEAPVPENTQ
jgi:hypothetical protein